MATVKLIVTGDAEMYALAESIKPLFPAHDFYPHTTSTDFIVPSFTSCNVRAAPTTTATGSLRAARLANELVASVALGRDEADLIVAVEDLEIDNPFEEVSFVTGCLANAIREHLDTRVHSNQHGRTRADIERRLREKCSFHLLAPMVESYFFRDPAALVRARATMRPSCVDAGIDIEKFAVDCGEYLSPTGPLVLTKPPVWLKPIDRRRRHPKHYVQFLCDPSGTDKHAYRERDGGSAALRSLAWVSVLGQSAQTTLAHSFFDDIAHALNEPNPCAGDCAPETRRSDAPTRLLRNVG